MKKTFFAAAVLFVAVTLSAVGWFVWSDTGGLAQAAMAEYQIEKLTCGSCVANIEKALDNVKGVQSIDVNLTSNRGRVIFDPERISGEAIGQAISQAGYPARLKSQLTPAEYRDLQNEQALMGQKFIARIGGRFVTPEEFDLQVRFKQPGADATAAQDGRLRAAVWQEVLQRELLLAAAERSNIVIQEGEVDLRIKEISGNHAGFEQLIAARYGDMQAFREMLRQDMVINRNLEDNVFRGITSPLERQKIFQSWYAELARSTDVVIFDPQLKTAAAKGGCGGGCCG